MPLIFQSTAVARPAYYDRNPTMSLLAYNAGGIGPHATTNRTSFTVPANKKAWLDDLWLRMTRSGVAGAAALVQILVAYTPAGGGVAYMNWIESAGNVTSVPTIKDIISTGFLNTGDLVQVQTTDSSTGGTMDYTVACKTTTFDS